MKKQTVSIIILVSILALLLLSYFAIKNIKPKDSKDENGSITGYTSVWEIPIDNISEYSIETRDYSYTLVKSADTWRVKDNDIIKLDNEKVNDMVKAVAVLNAQDEIKDSIEKLSNYGLDNPTSATITLKTKDEYRTLKIGNMAPTQDRHYFMVNGSDAIYTLYYSATDSIIKDLDSIRMKTIHKITPEGLSNDDAFVSYTLTNPDGSKVAVRVKTNEETAKDIAANSFIMTEPYYKNVNTDEFQQEVLYNIPNITALTYVDDKPADLSKYGLDVGHRKTLQIKTVNNELNLYIGSEQSGFMYAQSVGEPSVFTVGSNVLSFINTDPFFLLDKSVYLKYINDVSRITLNGPFENYIFEVQKNGDKFEYTLNSIALNEDAAQSVYGGIIGLTISGTADEAISGNADYEFTFEFNNGNPADNIKFISENDRMYVISINGKIEFTIDKKQLQQLFENIKNQSQNPQ